MRRSRWHGTKAFLPYLIASGDGDLVNISSVFGLVGVSCVYPGGIRTNIAKSARHPAEQSEEFARHGPDAYLFDALPRLLEPAY